MSEPPKFYRQARAQYPELFTHFEALSEAAKRAGPLDAKTVALAKLAMSLGASLESSAHSAVRKALAADCTPEEIRHVALLGITTLGFPTTMRSRAWVEDVLRKSDP